MPRACLRRASSALFPEICSLILFHAEMDVIDLCDDDDEPTTSTPGPSRSSSTASQPLRKLILKPKTDAAPAKTERRSISFDRTLPSTSTRPPTTNPKNASRPSASGLQIVNVKSLNQRKRVASQLSDNDNAAGSSSSQDDGPKKMHRRKSALVPMKMVQNDPLEFVEASNANLERANASEVEEMLENVVTLPNPNLDLIRKVAFLRVSVSYMLEELGMRPVQLGKTCYLSKLKAQYTRNKYDAKK